MWNFVYSSEQDKTLLTQFFLIWIKDKFCTFKFLEKFKFKGKTDGSITPIGKHEKHGKFVILRAIHVTPIKSSDRFDLNGY